MPSCKVVMVPLSYHKSDISGNKEKQSEKINKKTPVEVWFHSGTSSKNCHPAKQVPFAEVDKVIEPANKVHRKYFLI